MKAVDKGKLKGGRGEHMRKQVDNKPVSKLHAVVSYKVTGTSLASPVLTIYECADPWLSPPHLFLFRGSKCSTQSQEFPFVKTL